MVRRRRRGFQPTAEGFEARRLLTLIVTPLQAEVLENPDANTTLQFQVTVEPTEEGIVVDYSTSPGGVSGCAPAVDGRDYVGVGSGDGQLVFTPGGPTTQTITIPVLGSYLIKPTVCFTLNLYRGDTEEDASAVGVIENDNSTVVTNTNATGYGSLYGAIESTDQTPGPHEISFDVPSSGPVTIPIASPLPALTNPANVDVDATTQTGSSPLPRVILDGSQAGSGANGLVVNGGNTTISGLGIQHFSEDGIALSNELGADTIADDTLAHNGGAGVDVYCSGNLINGNTIVSSGLSGVVLNSETTDNTVRGNTILGSGQSGVDDEYGQDDVIAGNTLGAPGLGNAYDGVTLNGAENVLVGGTATGAGNLIQANGLVGVRVNGPCGGDVIAGNTIGHGNLYGGVFLDDATGVLIGGTSAAARNLISGNGGAGLEILDGGGNDVQGNWIGVDSTGNLAAGNALDGIYLIDTSGNLIGGATPGAGNVVSGNGYVGVRIAGLSSQYNSLLGNRIGTNAAGTAAVGNTYDGVFLTQGANHTFLGGTVPGAGNLISDNLAAGIQLYGAGTSHNLIAGNLIGTNLTGLAALPNATDGVFLNGVSDNAVGAANAGNLISGNLNSGVQLYGASTIGNTVSGNRIGLNAANRPVLGNAVGIFLNQAGTNTIGGTGASANVVAGNHYGQTLVTSPGVPIPVPASARSRVHRPR